MIVEPSEGEDHGVVDREASERSVEAEAVARTLVAPEPVRSPVGGRAPTTFSVLITAYQVAEFLGESIRSALDQTLPPLEVIVCDDGSTDDIEAAVAPYVDRITFLRQENRGAGAAKNAAAHAASGEFLALLDGDDVYLPRRLEVLAEAARVRPDLDILTTNASIVLDGQILRRAYDETWTFDVTDQRRAILERCFVIGHAAMRRQAFVDSGGFDDTLRSNDDWDLWIRMILDGSRAGLVPEALSNYRVRAGSISTQRVVTLASGVTCLAAAERRGDLTPVERATAAQTRAEWSRMLLLAEAREGLIGREPGVRSRLRQIAFGPGFSASSRVKALVSALSPRIAGSRLASREQSRAEGAAGVRIERKADDEPAGTRAGNAK
jgi:hypothetical protein